MHSSICVVLLACLYGTSFAAPISPDSLTDIAQKLPIVRNPEQGDLAVGGVNRDVARSLVDGLAGSVTKDLPIVGGVDALTGLTGVAGSVPKAAPLAGKRAVTGEVVGTISKLTNDLPVAVKGAGINDVTDDAPLVGQKRDDAGALPLGPAGGIAKPVTDLVGNLQHLNEDNVGGITQ